MPDGSYVVTTQNPVYPYNVLPGDPMWQGIQDWLAAAIKIYKDTGQKGSDRQGTIEPRAKYF